MSVDTLGDRMKEKYENRYRFYFPSRIPIVIRIDGKAFHTYTRGLNKPFDSIFMKAMQQTALELVKNISNCKFGYVQSDEISLLLLNDDTNTTEGWFDNNIQKLDSVSASMATLYFNTFFQKYKQEYLSQKLISNSSFTDYENTLSKKEMTALFDSRSFILPREEVNNYFYWRQLDAIRNSILSCAQSYLGKSASMGFKCNELKEKMSNEINFNWEDLETSKKRGSAILFKPTEILRELENGTCELIIRNKASLDLEIPIFSENTDYINNIVYHKE